MKIGLVFLTAMIAGAQDPYGKLPLSF